MDGTAETQKNPEAGGDTVAIDRAAVLDRVGGDQDLLREITCIFLDEYPVLLGQIQAAASAGDASGLERAAHSLKGSVSNFGAPAATNAAYRLEILGRKKQLEGTETVIHELLSLFQQLHGDLQRLAS